MKEIVWFDIITLGIILIVGIKGIFNGLIKEVTGLIGIIAGIFIASGYAEECGNWISSNIFYMESTTALNMVGFLTLLSLIWLGFIIIGIILSKLITLSGMESINTLFGFIFAGGKIFVIISVIVYALSNIEIVKKTIEKYVESSTMFPIYYEAGKFITNLDTEEVKEKISTIKEKTKESIEESTKKVSDQLSSQKGL
jgi:membrane protein required for colicin V production